MVGGGGRLDQSFVRPTSLISDIMSWAHVLWQEAWQSPVRIVSLAWESSSDEENIKERGDWCKWRSISQEFTAGAKLYPLQLTPSTFDGNSTRVHLLASSTFGREKWRLAEGLI